MVCWWISLLWTPQLTSIFQLLSIFRSLLETIDHFERSLTPSGPSGLSSLSAIRLALSQALGVKDHAGGCTLKEQVFRTAQEGVIAKIGLDHLPSGILDMRPMQQMCLVLIPQDAQHLQSLTTTRVEGLRTQWTRLGDDHWWTIHPDELFSTLEDLRFETFHVHFQATRPAELAHRVRLREGEFHRALIHPLY